MLPLNTREVRLLTLGDVKRLLSGYISKFELIRLGNVRFGFPSRTLQQKSMVQMENLIIHAMDKEETMNIIARQADIAGKNRRN